MNTKVLTEKQRNWFLIILCFCLYTSSYFLKLGYTANIVEFESFYSVSHTEAGVVGTLFFVAYGAGQLVNAFLVKKYPLRYMVPVSIFISCIMNLLVVFSPSFIPIKYYWLIDGASLSILWPSMIRTIGENVDTRYKKIAVLFIGTTTAVGTSISYGLSALFSYLQCFKNFFFVGISVGLFFALIWFLFSEKLMKKPEKGEIKVTAENKKPTDKTGEKKKITFAFLFWIFVVGIIGVATALSRDGLQTWFPLILKQKYGLTNSVSILITLLLPVVQIFGTSIGLIMNKWIKDYTVLSSFFLTLALGLLIMSLYISLPTPVLTIILFTAASLLFSAVVNITTSQMPILMESHGNSGFYAGLFNAMCYAGSAISSFGLGIIADHHGWDAAILFVIIFGAVTLFIAYSFLLFRLFKNKHSK